MISQSPEILALQLHEEAVKNINNHEWDRAVIACKKALKLHPNLAMACKTLGIAFQCQDKFTEAHHWYKKALEIQPNFAEVYSNLGSLYAKQNQWRDAIKAYRQALKINPNLAGVYRNLAKVWTELDNIDNCIQCQYKALKIEPSQGSADDYIQLGNKFLKYHKLTKAIACYKQGIKLYPDTFEAYHNLGEVFTALKQLNKAKFYYKKALIINPQSTMTYRCLEKILIQEQNWDQVIKVYHQHLTVDPNCFETHRSLGKVLLEEERPQEAMDSFLKAMEIKPDFSWSYWNLWNILAEYKKLQQAREILVTAIDKFPDSFNVELNLGEVLSRQQQLPQAMVAYGNASYKKMVRSHPEIVNKYWDNSYTTPPNFIIIGTQKGGTTSLYRYLEQHPKIVGCIKKETHFWTQNFNRGLDWYLSHFPSLSLDANIVTGEATPNYLESEEVPDRLYQIFPNIKLIILLRNPITRAVSQYYHWVRLMRESQSLETVITSQLNLVQNQVNTSSKEIKHPGYLWRGLYLPFLKKWMSVFPRKQFFIVSSEEFYQNPQQVFNQVLDFLDLPSHQLTNYCCYNSGRYPEIDPLVYKQLQDYFYPHNQKLQDFLKLDFPWD